MRKRRRRLFLWAAASLACGPVWGQEPLIPPPPPGPWPVAPNAYAHAHHHGGGAVHHVGRAVHEHFIGDPDLFNIPPLGYSLYATMSSQVGKANLHTFTLYRSDFHDGTNQLTPSGSWRLSHLVSRLPAWNGPLVVEWTPEQPELAAVRRDTVLNLLRGSSIPLADNRIVVGPSPYTGILGTDAANNYNLLIQRDIRAPQQFSYTPTATATFAGGSR